MQKINGFSLIELLTVIGIIGILASFSYPTYRDSVVRARRSDAKSSLMGQAQRVERFYNETNSYEGVADEFALPESSSEGFYTINIKVPDPSTKAGYLLIATPQKGQAENDKECQSFTFNEQGITDVTSGPGGSPTQTGDYCWAR